MQVKKVRLDGKAPVETEVVSDDVQHLYVGGLGIAAKLMSELLNGVAEPLAPEVPLIVSVGPLNATGFPAANRIMFYSVSPATALVSGTWMGGQLGTQLAKTGTPTYVFVGRAPEPSIVVIDDDNVKVVSRLDLWGRKVSEVRSVLEA